MKSGVFTTLADSNSNPEDLVKGDHGPKKTISVHKKIFIVFFNVRNCEFDWNRRS